MKLYDAIAQFITLLVYVGISPFLFGVIYPTTGDVSMIWIWVVVVTGMTAGLSYVYLVMQNFFLPPERTYWAKGLVPLMLSSFLAFKLGEIQEEDIRTTFLIMNAFILVGLYFLYAQLFARKMRKNQ